MGGNREPIADPGGPDIRRVPTRFSKVIATHGTDDSILFDLKFIEYPVEVVLFTHFGEPLSMPQLTLISQFLNKSPDLDNKDIMYYNGKVYSIPGANEIVFKVFSSEDRANSPTGKLCPDLILSSNDPRELDEASRGFIGVYNPLTWKFLPVLGGPALYEAGKELPEDKEATDILRYNIQIGRFAYKGNNVARQGGARLSSVIKGLAEYYKVRGKLNPGTVFRLFISACNSKPVGLPANRVFNRPRSFRLGRFPYVFGRTPSTAQLLTARRRKRKNRKSRRNRKY
jgi:hypothetical protein